MSEVFKIIPAPAKTLWFLGAIALFMAVFLCLFLYIAYSIHNVEFRLSSTELSIKGDLYGRSIPLNSLILDQALEVDLTQQSGYQPKWRINGIGLPGYSSGWFKLKNGEKALLFVTDFHQVIYLPTRDKYSLLMSVEKPSLFLDHLKKIASY